MLTRLPLPLRLSGAQAAEVLAAAFPDGCWLDVEASNDLLARLAELGVVGGSVYDALVGRAAISNGRRLLTRDRRAERTYRAMDVEYRFLD